MSKVPTKKPRLGRGLSSLISTPVAITPPPADPQADLPPSSSLSSPPAPAAPAPSASPLATSIAASIAADPVISTDPAGASLAYLDIDTIEPNPHQPRRTFDPASLDQLAISLKQDGVMQPIVVRRLPGSPSASSSGGGGGASGGVRWQLVAGERRWRAAKLAQLPRIPAVVRDLTDQQLAEWAVIENLQREDLNPIDRAEAFASLAQQFHLSHQDIAGRLGVDRSTIANTLRLLDLHPDIRDLVRQARLSAGHGRALLGLPNPESQLVLARRAVAGGWSVRMIEAAVRRLATADAASAPTPTRATRSAHLQELEQQIAQQLSTKVRVKPARRKGAGTLLIEFYNLDQFDTLLQRLGVTLEH